MYVNYFNVSSKNLTPQEYLVKINKMIELYAKDVISIQHDDKTSITTVWFTTEVNPATDKDRVVRADDTEELGD